MSLRIAHIVVLGSLLICGCRRHDPSPTNLVDAAQQGDIRAVGIFLSKGADANIPGPNGRSAMEAAVIRPDNSGVIELLIQHGANVNKAANGAPPLVLADDSNVRQLVLAGADVNWRGPNGGSVPGAAVQSRRNPSLIRLLLDKGANPNPPNVPLILSASQQDEAVVVGLLIRSGTKLGDDHGGAALNAAVHHCDIELVHILLDAGADAKWCDEHQNGLLAKAIVYPQASEVIEALIAAGADVNQANDAGETPLWLCRKTGANPAIGEVLGAAGAVARDPQEVLKARRKVGAIGN
ncbi:MAG TPA: ankyrin repeat domain-containing protein [Tepidisphaeraceae bacterium]|jgi:ankyrin repeat protein|nr:ankyrin repeat domain-containing protein [Tepidisphaeraceae bacterium]